MKRSEERARDKALRRRGQNPYQPLAPAAKTANGPVTKAYQQEIADLKRQLVDCGLERMALTARVNELHAELRAIARDTGTLINLRQGHVVQARQELTRAMRLLEAFATAPHLTVGNSVDITVDVSLLGAARDLVARYAERELQS